MACWTAEKRLAVAAALREEVGGIALLLFIEPLRIGEGLNWAARTGFE